MRTAPRTRHYVSPGALTLCRPVLSFDYARDAYTLRGIGDRVGPVLRENRRRGRPANRYKGPERRGILRSARTEAPVKVASPRAASSARAASSTRSTSSARSANSAPASRPKAVGQTRSKASRRARSKNARG